MPKVPSKKGRETRVDINAPYSLIVQEEQEEELTVINILITTHGSLSDIQSYNSRSNRNNPNISTIQQLKMDPSSSFKLNRIDLDESGECSRISKENMHEIIDAVNDRYTQSGSIFSEELNNLLNSQQEIVKEKYFNIAKDIAQSNYNIAVIDYDFGIKNKKPNGVKPVRKLSYEFVMRPHRDDLMVINKSYSWDTGIEGVKPFIIYTSDQTLESMINESIYSDTNHDLTLYILIIKILSMCEVNGNKNIELNIIDTSCNAQRNVANAKIGNFDFTRVPKGGKKHKRTKRRKGTRRKRKGTRKIFYK